ncbi:hypothetical protein TNCV_2020331, partial [Trichonephila clavipes]
TRTFGDGPRNFEQMSSDEDDPKLAPSTNCQIPPMVECLRSRQL